MANFDDTTYRDIQAIIANSRRITAELAKRAGKGGRTANEQAAREAYAAILNRNESIGSMSVDDILSLLEG
jgi:hypothetical protein